MCGTLRASKNRAPIKQHTLVVHRFFDMEKRKRAEELGDTGLVEYYNKEIGKFEREKSKKKEKLGK